MASGEASGEWQVASHGGRAAGPRCRGGAEPDWARELRPLSIRVRVPSECAEWRVASGREWLARVPVGLGPSGEWRVASGDLEWRVVSHWHGASGDGRRRVTVAVASGSRGGRSHGRASGSGSG